MYRQKSFGDRKVVKKMTYKKVLPVKSKGILINLTNKKRHEKYSLYAFDLRLDSNHSIRKQPQLKRLY